MKDQSESVEGTPPPPLQPFLPISNFNSIERDVSLVGTPPVVTVFDSITATTGRVVPVSTFDELVNLTLHNVTSLHTFTDNRRSKDNFLATSFLVVDDDSGTPVAEVIESHAGQACAVFTTRSHQMSKGGRLPRDMTRTIIRLSRPISDAGELGHNYALLREAYPALDRQTVDAARLWFPAREAVYINERGSLWEVKNPPPSPTPASVSTPVPVVSGEVGLLTHRTLRFINTYLEGCELNWHSELIWAIQDFKAQGYTQDECAENLALITGYLTKDDRYQIRYGFEKCINFKIAFKPRIKRRAK